MPGIVAFLGAASRAGVDRARDLLNRAAPWLLDEALPGEDAAYPAWRTPGLVPTAARLAWCYGDAGIAAALLTAADATGRDDWRRAAHHLARRVARRSFESSGVMDAMVCHGAAGIGHILNRLSVAFNNDALAEAARTWLRRALAFRMPGTGIAGFTCMMPDEAGVLVQHADMSLLVGTAGLGLVLTAAISDTPPDWDRMLLIS